MVGKRPVVRQRQIEFAVDEYALQDGLLQHELPVGWISLANSRRGPYRSSQDSERSDMEGNARYFFSTPGSREQAFQFDCAQTDSQNRQQGDGSHQEPPCKI